jgi:hypothetical protein
MDDQQKQRDLLLNHLSNMLPVGDAETIVTAATRPNDVLAMEMTKLIWEDLPATKKSALGETVTTLQQQIPAENSGVEIISPAAQKRRSSR